MTTSDRTSTSSTISSTTHAPATMHRPPATSSALLHDTSGDVDREAAIIVGTSLIFIALTFMLFLIGMVFRRKSSTGSFFKPARYSLGSMMTGAARYGADDRASHQATQGMATDGNHHDGNAACPAPSIASTIRPLSESLASSSPHGRRSVGLFRTNALLSRGLRHHQHHPGDGVHELAAAPVTPGVQSHLLSRQPSFTSVDPDDYTPRASTGPFYHDASRERSMVVVHSPTATSSSGVPDSQFRDITTISSSRGESRDAIGPMIAPVASYRDRRPAGLTLPTATNRFRDQRLAPIVHYHDESPDGVSPLYRDRVSPWYRDRVSPSPNYRPHGNNGYPPSPPQSHRGRVSPMVHYPSFGELSRLDFGSDEGTPRASMLNDADVGDDGWRRDGDGVSGRHQMG